MTQAMLAGVFLILVPLLFNVVFFLLQRSFGYPDILRKPTDEVLRRFHAGGTLLVALWYIFLVSALLFIPLVLIVPQVLGQDRPLFLTFLTAIGLLAGLCQILGIARWPFLVPHLAKQYTAPDTSKGTHDAVVVVFQAFHRYAGVAIGEHLGYLFTSVWTVLLAIAIAGTSPFPPWIGWIGIVPALGIFVGLFEEAGFRAAGAINASSYILWSLWLISIGAILVF